MSHDKHVCHVGGAVEVNVKQGTGRNLDIALLRNLPRDTGLRGLTRLQRATRQLPFVAFVFQEHPPPFEEDNALNGYGNPGRT